jgi:hypothetical protein
MKQTIIIAASAALLLGAGASRGSAADHFVIVQPGYPGTTADAETFIADLAGAIARAGGPKDLRGWYHNDEKEGLAAIAEKKPFFGIVSLGFYLAHRKELGLAPILGSRPSEPFSLAAKKGSPTTLAELEGQVVQGTAFTEMEFVKRILFGPGAKGGPPAKGEAAPGSAAGKAGDGAAVEVGRWKAQAASSYSKAGREVGRGKVRAVLFTERERRAMDQTIAGKELEVFWRSEPLPTALVVSFGKEDRGAKDVAAALEKIKDTADGKEVVKLMGIEGFAPVDPKVVGALEARYDGAGDGKKA